ncbi:MAG: hypothetical protein WBQ26_00860 [Gemmatimonadaceae bacterium]|nr:hypothetical protein [Gemmatimonadaceae bacterium]
MSSAEILVFGATGYETAVRGSNGFVCFVGRSWAQEFGAPEFWNPKIRTPQCWNAAAVSRFGGGRQAYRVLDGLRDFKASRTAVAAMIRSSTNR